MHDFFEEILKMLHSSQYVRCKNFLDMLFYQWENRTIVKEDY